jgi:hypothetical protein
MRLTIIAILIVVLFSCVSHKQVTEDLSPNTFYIDKIKTKNNWHFIHASRNDSVFMIVSKKALIFMPNHQKIKVGNYCDLNLNSIIPVINGIKMIPMNYLDFEGISLDERTTVNINPDKGIYDIYKSDNLNGLYLKK